MGSVSKLASQAAHHIRLQAQNMPADGGWEPKAPPGHMAKIELQDAAGRHVTFAISSDWDELPLLEANKELIAPEPFQELLDACLSKAACRYNLPANRVGLLEAVAVFSARLTADQRYKVRQTTVEIAESDATGELRELMRQVGVAHPLSAHKVDLGDAAGVQGAALRCLAELQEAATPEEMEETNRILVGALLSPDAAVRRAAAIATQYMRRVNDTVLTGLLWGLRDPDSEAATCCFWSLTHKDKLNLDVFKAGLLVTSIQITAKSGHRNARRAAAALAGKAGGWLLHGSIWASDLEAVRHTLAADPCFSVREMLREAVASDSPD